MRIPDLVLCGWESVFPNNVMVYKSNFLVGIGSIKLIEQIVINVPIPTLKTMSSSAVIYRNELNKGIMSSWKNNAKNHVSTNSLIQIVYTISLTKFIV